MDLKTYIKSMSDTEMEAFAFKADTSVAYIKQVASGHRKAGSKSIFNFIRASDGVLTAESLRPDLAGAA